MMIKKIVPFCLTGTLLLSGCSVKEQSAKSVISVTESEGSFASQNNIDPSDMFTDRDLEVGYDEDSCIAITLTGDSVVSDSNAVEVSGSTITISEEGTYLLSGSLTDGMILVDAGNTAKIQLILANATIENSDSAAIYVRSADKVFISTAEGSENRLSNGGTYRTIDENNIDAVLFSKSDLTLNGTGTLIITAEAGHGVVSKDDLVLTSGVYQIAAAEHGLSGKDSVRIMGGTYTIQSGKDGIHAENADDESLGFLYIVNGTFTITAEGDGMSASAYLLIENGSYTIEAGGGSSNAAVQDKIPGPPEDTVAETAETDDISTKGLKAGTDLLINNGSFTINSADDALHSNGDVTISGGSLQIMTGDDGIHGDAAVTIMDGEITISQSYEGIEGLSIDINGGTIDITASDDGLNAAGGTDGNGSDGHRNDVFAVTEGAYISISGGILTIDAGGDGIDSNGDLMVSGGETYVAGPVSGGDSALDYNGDAHISGGNLIAVGSSKMAQNFGSASTQGVIMVTLEETCGAGSLVTLADSRGEILLSWEPDKEFGNVIVSCPEIIKGETYTLAAGEMDTEVTMDSLIYESMGHGGPGRGEHQGRPFPNRNEIYDMQKH